MKKFNFKQDILKPVTNMLLIAIIMIISIVMISEFTTALTGYEYLSNYTEFYYSMDEDYRNETHITDLSKNWSSIYGGNITWNNTAKINTSRYGIAQTGLGWATNSTYKTNTYTMSFWIYPNRTGYNQNGYIMTNDGGAYNGHGIYIYQSKVCIHECHPNTCSEKCSTGTIDLNQWNHIVISSESGNGTMYKNNVSFGTFTGVTSNGVAWAIGRSNVAFDYADGGIKDNIDEVILFNKSLNTSEISFLYNSGTPISEQQYPYTSIVIPPNSTVLNVSFTAENYYNSDFDINSFTLQFNNNGTLYSTTNGTIYLNDYNTSNLLNISLTNVTNHYDINYSDVNLSSGSYVLKPLNIVTFSAFNIYNPNSYYNYNQTQTLKWSTPTSLINSSISRYNITLTGDNSNVVFVVTNNTATNSSNYDFINYFDRYTIKITAIDEYGLTGFNTSNLYVNPKITNCNQSIVLNSTGENLIFNLTNKIPSPILPIQAGQAVLRLGAFNTIGYYWPVNTTFYNYKTTIYNGTYNNLTTGFNGVYKLYAFENYPGYTDTLCTLSLCVNNYVRTTEPCIDNLRYINYTDVNNCAAQYDIPSDIGNYEDCVASVTPDKDTIFIWILLILWILSLLITITMFPLAVIITFLSGAGLMYYLITYLALATMPAAFLSLVILGLTIFSLVIGLRNK